MKIVIYHHNDPDGIISAAIVNGKYYEEEIQFVPSDYNIDVPFFGKEDGYDKCILIDFCFSKELMQKFYDSYGEDFIWIDHHATAIKKVEDLNDKIKGVRDLENNNSGCGLAWNYYFPSKETPNIVKWVEDIDLWKFKYAETKPFIAGLCMEKIYPDDDYILTMIFDKHSEWETLLINNGTTLNKAQLSRVKSVIKNGKEISFHGYKTLAINCPVDDSMLGNYACKELGYEIGLVWRVKQDQVTIGLRSNSNEVDVGKIAEQYDGGGHVKASGFQMDLQKFIDLVYKNDTL